MKKIYSILLAALAVCAVSCQEGPLETQAPEGSQEGRIMTFTASVDGTTKAVLNGLKTDWQDGDGITVFASDGTKAVFTTTLEAPAPTAAFSGRVEGEFPAPYTAVYGTMDQSKVKLVDGKVVGVDIKPVQLPVENSFDRFVLPAIAVAETAESTLAFKLAGSLVKFTVGEENVNNVTFWGKKNGVEGNVLCSGESCTIEHNNGNPIVSGQTDGYARVWAGDGKLKKGATYFMVITPGEYDEITLELDTKVSRHATKNFTFQRGHIVNLGELKFMSTPFGLRGEKVTTADGTALNWGADLLMTMDGNYWVAKNLTFAQGAKFKVLKDGEWLGGDFAEENWLELKGNNYHDFSYSGNETKTYDLYVKEGQPHKVLIAPAGTTWKTLTLKVKTSTLNGRDHIHFWVDGGYEILNGGAVQTVAIDGEYSVWKISAPDFVLGKQGRIIFKTGEGWDNMQTVDSEQFVIETEMYFDIDEKITAEKRAGKPIKITNPEAAPVE